MLTYKDIITSFTLKLSEVFSNVNVYVDDTTNGVDGSCFYVQLVPMQTLANTKETDKKSLLVSIKYYQEAKKSKLDLLDMIDSLNNNFNRGIQVEDRYLNFNNIEPNILKDDVGYYLDYLISISFIDDIYITKEEFENMQNVEINLTV
jgi:hypothetical protein